MLDLGFAAEVMLVPVAFLDKFKHGFGVCFNVFAAYFALMIHSLHSYLGGNRRTRLRLI